MPSIATLIFSDWTYITTAYSDTGAVALAQAFHHNSTYTLRTYNIISDIGEVALAQASCCNSTLKRIDLRISDTGAAALATALYHNATLNLLDLCENCDFDAGAVVLAQALHQKSVLMDLITALVMQEQ